jgi:hypothetical protein
MSKCKVGKTEPAAQAEVCDEPEVNLARRRALVQAGWAVPVILGSGLVPCKAKATYPGQAAIAVSPLFSTEQEALEAIPDIQICHEPGHLCATQAEFGAESTQFFVVDP